MLISKRSAVLIALLAVLAIPSQGAVTTYTNRTEFLLAAKGLTSIDFSNAVPSGGYRDFANPTDPLPHAGLFGYADSGVQFIGRLNSYPYYRISAADETILPAFTYSWNSGVTLWGNPNPGWMWAELPSGTRAVGCDIMTVNVVTGVSGAPMLVTLNAGSPDGPEGTAISVPTLARPLHAFIGFISDDPITKIQFQSDNSSVYPAIDNFVFGTNTGTPGLTVYNNRAAFIAAASSLTNVDFSAAGTAYKDWIGNEGPMPHTGSYGYADPSGVEFIGRLNSWPLYRVSTANQTKAPDFFYAWNSGVTLWGNPNPGWMWAELPVIAGGYHAVGADIMTAGAYEGESGLNMLVGLNMGSAGSRGTGLISVPTMTRPEHGFVGFISTDPITKIEFQSDSNFVYPGIDNFVFGQAGTARPVVGANNKAAKDAIIDVAKSNYQFVMFGKVTEITDAATFTLDDGSGNPIKVVAAGHPTFNVDSFVRAKGILDNTSLPPTLQCNGSDVEVLN